MKILKWIGIVFVWFVLTGIVSDNNILLFIALMFWPTYIIYKLILKPAFKTMGENAVGEDDRNPGSIRTKIAGISKENRQELVKLCRSGQKIAVRHDPVDGYPHAFAVYTEIKGSPEKLGYINDDLAKDLYGKFGDRAAFGGKILEITGGTSDRPTRGCNIEFVAV